MRNSIVNRLKKLELVNLRVNEIAIVDGYLRLIELSIAGDEIFEIPDFTEYRQMQVKGG